MMPTNNTNKFSYIKFIILLYFIYYDRIDVSEDVDVNKTSESKECNICDY